MFGTSRQASVKPRWHGSLVAAILLTMSMISTANELDEIKLVSFVDPPYMFEPDQNKAGLVALIVEKLFQRTRIAYKLELMPKKRAIIFAETNKNTCVLPIERSQEREVKFSWISPVLISTTGLFSSPDNPIKKPIITLMDAQDFRIGSQLGSASGEYLRALGFKVEAVPRNTANLHKLKAGRIDLWESDAITARYISQKSGVMLSKSSLDFFTHLYAIGCNLSISIDKIELIRDALMAMYRDGTIDKLNNEFNP